MRAELHIPALADLHDNIPAETILSPRATMLSRSSGKMLPFCWLPSVSRIPEAGDLPDAQCLPTRDRREVPTLIR